MKILQSILLFGALAVLTPGARAQSAWNVASGLWTNAGNWSPVGVPAGTNALIDNSGAATLSSSAPVLNPGQLYVGSNTFGNQLWITNGGVLVASNGTVGFAAGSSNNSLTVSGPGSSLNVASLTVGNSGSGNEANVLAGGFIRSTGAISIGVASTSSNNALLFNGAGSGVRLGSTQAMVVGDGGVGNRLISTNGGRLTNFGSVIIGSQAGSSNNTAHVHGTGSVWNSSGSFLLGARGSGNQLTVSGGGVMSNNQFNGFATIGGFPSSSNNTLLVTGTGSVWATMGFLTVGSSGVNHQMIITDGGLVTNFSTAYVGDSSSGSGHTVTVSGPGAAWHNGGLVYLGLSAPNNQLLIRDGGTVLVASDLLVGNFGAPSTNNLVLLTNGSSLTVRGYYALSSGSHRQFDGTATVGNLQFNTSSNRPPFQFLGGVFNVTNSTSIFGIHPFVVGDGPAPVLFTVAGSFHNIGVPLRIAANATFQQQRGAVSLSISFTNSLVVTNATAAYQLLGGSLTLSGFANVSNSQPFSVGNGTNVASLILPAGFHTFADGILVNSNGTLSGSPTLACPLTFLSGSTLSPGSTIGAITNAGPTEWNGGMRYDWAITNATGTPGNGWDVFATTNIITCNASPTNRLVLRISGTPANFTNGSAYIWTLATAAGGFSGFDTNHITLDTSALPATNTLSAGYFSVTTSGGTNLNLVFTPLSFTVDTDADGITDAAELQWAPLGFNWQISQPALASNFLATAYNTGLYTTNNLQALYVGNPLILRNTTNGLFTLTIGVRKSTNLLNYVPFPMTVPQTSINGSGELEFQFPSSDGASFYRLQSQ